MLLTSQNSDVHYITKSYYGINKWYRVYSDGWIEQGGYYDYQISDSDGTWVSLKRVSFPLSFRQSIASLICSDDAKWPNAYIIRTSDINNNGFSISEDNVVLDRNKQGQGQIIKVYYYACGF